MGFVDVGGRKLGVVGLLQTDGACSHAAHINIEGDGNSFIPMNYVDPVCSR